jgi:hypothetical protein
VLGTASHEVVVPGKLTVAGLIDPTGLELVPQSAFPGTHSINTVWKDGSNRKLFFSGGYVSGPGFDDTAPTEEVVGSISGSRGTVVVGSDTGVEVRVNVTEGAFISTETITGQVTGTTALLNGVEDPITRVGGGLLVGDGNNTDVGIGFTNEPGSGLSRIGTGSIGISVLGGSVLVFDNSNQQMELHDYDFHLAGGDVSNPGIQFNNSGTGTGISSPFGTDSIQFGISGSPYVFIDSTKTRLENILELGDSSNIADSNSALAVDLGDSSTPLRYLYDLAGSVVKMDWENGDMWDSGGTQAIDWHDRQLMDDTGSVAAVGWNNRSLNDSGGNVAVDWENRILGDTGGSNRLEWTASDGLYALGVGLAMDQISAPGGTSSAGGGIIYFDSSTGALMVQFAGGSAVQIEPYA